MITAKNFCLDNLMIKSKFIEELNETLQEMLDKVILAEEQDPDFTIIREIGEQLKDEIESLE